MSEHEFARLVQVNRNRLGLSQARVAELIGRAPATVRSWEKGDAVPTEPAVVAALAAVLAIKEDDLFAAARVKMPVKERRQTIEQALLEIAPLDEGLSIPDEPTPQTTKPVLRPGDDPALRQRQLEAIAELPGLRDPDVIDTGHSETAEPPEPGIDGESEADLAIQASSESTPVKVSVPPAILGLIDKVRDGIAAFTFGRRSGFGRSAASSGDRSPSYLEITEERLAYKARTIYTAIALAVLLFALTWSISKTLDALGKSMDLILGRL